jgi:hypothetical protein
VAYPVDLALDQWRHGERRIVGEPALADAADAVLAEVRRRLGGGFTIAELADLYGDGTDWAVEVANRHASGTGLVYAVDAAFARYARQASDYAGGRHRAPGEG